MFPNKDFTSPSPIKIPIQDLILEELDQKSTDFQSKELIFIPIFSSLPLCLKRNDTKNHSTGMSSNSFSSNEGNGTRPMML
jgi:hypothetical protein